MCVLIASQWAWVLPWFWKNFVTKFGSDLMILHDQMRRMMNEWQKWKKNDHEKVSSVYVEFVNV